MGNFVSYDRMLMQEQQMIEPIPHGPMTDSMHLKNLFSAIPGVLQQIQDLRHGVNKCHFGGACQLTRACLTNVSFAHGVVAAGVGFKRSGKFLLNGDLRLSMRYMQNITKVALNWSKNANERRPQKLKCYATKCTHLCILVPEDTQAWKKKGPAQITPGVSTIATIDDWTVCIKRGLYIIPTSRIQHFTLHESNKSRANIPKDAVYAMLTHARNLGYVAPVPAANKAATYSILSGLTYHPLAS